MKLECSSSIDSVGFAISRHFTQKSATTCWVNQFLIYVAFILVLFTWITLSWVTPGWVVSDPQSPLRQVIVFLRVLPDTNESVKVVSVSVIFRAVFDDRWAWNGWPSQSRPEKCWWCVIVMCCKSLLFLQELTRFWLLTNNFPVPSDRHLSCDDCLEDKSEDYQNCSVLYYVVPQLYTVISTHTYEQFLQVYLGLLMISVSLRVFCVFLQRVSIACYAERCISYDRFCLTDRLSVTRWYHAKTTPATIMGSSLEDSPMTLVSSTLDLTPKFQRERREWGRRMREG